MGQGKTSLIGNLLASMPWLKNKTFLIPALASVLVVSLVGVVLAVQGSNTARSDEEIVEVPQAEPELEIAAEPAIGAACVEGEPVCEFVKVHLLSDSGWTWVGFYEQFIDYVVEVNSISRAAAEDVVAAVEFDWCAESTRSGSSSPGNICGETSPGSGSAGPAAPDLDSAVEYVKFYVEDFSASRIDLIERLVQDNRFTRDEIIAAIDLLDVDWNREALQKAQDFAAQGPFSRKRLYGALISVNFEPSEAFSGVDALGIDWYEQAERAALAFLQRQAPPCQFSYESAVDYLVTEEYFTEDEALFGLYPFDDYENDRWLVCGP
jgi:hypothetical protein